MMQEMKLNIVKSIPFLQSEGEQLISRMYEILFQENPELKHMFNGDNSKKLAGALIAFAQNLERLEILQAALNNMALIHVRAGVKPEHYDKVWNALHRAMLEFGINDEIIKAWNDAYRFLANILISKEQRLYACLKES